MTAARSFAATLVARGRPKRTKLLLVASLATLVPFALLARDARAGHVSAWDVRILRFVHGYEERSVGSAFDRTVNAFLGMGGEIGTLIFGLIVLAILLTTQRIRDALFLIAASATAAALTFPLKDAFERAGVKYSFPSGHAALSASVTAATVFSAWPTRWRWPALAVGSVFTAALGTSLVYEGWHLPSDVIGGWCLALTSAALLRAAFFTRAHATR
jgi:membrane-associated phospholipid phosphatase